ncbi:MAG: hypothetical protein ACLGXA_17690 [Acidobacteriota bacterium]
MRSILPKIVLASAVAAMAALTTSKAFADIRVNVPFSFTANGKECPAGYYSVGRNNMTGVVTLRDDSWKRAFSWVMSSGDPAPTDSRVILRFDKDGDHYTLQSVQYHALITSQLDGRKKNSEAPTEVLVGQ